VESKDTQSSRGRATQSWATIVDPSPPGSLFTPPAAAPPHPAAGDLEIAVVDEEAAEASHSLGRATYEVWTRSRVYLLDAALVCLAVTCRDTGLVEVTSRCRGAQLVGARRRVDDVVEFWRPLPVPGSVAIFEPAGGRSMDSLTTSTVERVVLRQRVRRLPVHTRPCPSGEAR
jgi:hypothetical protein